MNTNLKIALLILLFVLSAIGGYFLFRNLPSAGEESADVLPPPAEAPGVSETPVTPPAKVSGPPPSEKGGTPPPAAKGGGATCGDNICETGEEIKCPSDC